MVFDIEDWVRL